MKVFKTNGNLSLFVDNVDKEETREKVQIKVTHVMPTETDVNICSGTVKMNYPFVFGHMAIGVVSDNRYYTKEGELLPELKISDDEVARRGLTVLQRGTKVVLNPYVVDSAEVSDSRGRVKMKGEDTDGFMQDFVFMDTDKFVPFPAGVEDKEAIFADKIAIALAALNSFPQEKGEYVAIVGAGAIGNIIAQLALYFQMIPIVIDDNASRLAKAAEKGIYYTVNATKEVPVEKVKEITGGRMCEHTILEATATGTGSNIFSLTKVGGDCTVVCEHNAIKRFDADVSLISRRNLTVKGVSGGAFEYNSAINLLAQGVLDLDGFIEKTVEVEEADRLLYDLKQNSKAYYASVIKL
ncbi:MAG: zinc-binding dehydrogenase [Clostridia bacterium]|nr:zinc-binding dehydrogenase [Clostridia bacterium]